MPDYSKSKIYCIKKYNDDTFMYIGSTIQSLSQRLAMHRRDSGNKYTKSKLYTAVNEEWDKFYIELVENVPCKNREELLKKESGYISKYATHNSRQSYKSLEDYKEYYRQECKKYYKKNTERIKEANKNYREQNSEHLKEKQKELYLKKCKEVYNCECGATFRYLGRARHFKTNKHLQNMNK